MSLKRSRNQAFIALLFIVVFVAFNSTTKGYSSASATAYALATVVKPLEVAPRRNLSFGFATPGEGALTISPQDSGRSAEFIVTGEPGMSYSISVPFDGEVSLTTPAGSSQDEQIPIIQFRSNTASGTIGTNGTDVVYIGATRAALRPSQTIGEYVGIFTITLTYQ